MIWVFVTAFIAAIATWAWVAGCELRNDAWQYSRTIRFHYDVSNSVHWGSMVVHAADELAHANGRRLTFWELVRGEGQVYDDLVAGGPPDANYGLDYPPMRLMVMTLWVRHVQEKLPAFDTWPGAWQLKYDDHGDAMALVNEDVARPLLDVNTWATAASAVLAFLLTTLWTHRGGRPSSKDGGLVKWRPTPPRAINGLIVFPLATFAFFYGLYVAEMPVSEGDAWLSWEQWMGIALLLPVILISLRVMPPVHRAWASGLVAALLLWFDPNVLIGTHVWPQWDLWAIPPFLLAALLASVDWWLAAGIVMGIGMTFKGQTLLADPVLLLWPLFLMRWGALARVIVGFTGSAAVILSPWLVLANSPMNWSMPSVRWIGCVIAAGIVAVIFSLLRSSLQQRLLKKTPSTPISAHALAIFCICLLGTIIATSLFVLRRWPSDSELRPAFGLLLLSAILLPPWFLPRRTLGIWFFAVLGASIWMSAFIYHGDWSWLTVGFEYGTRKFAKMTLGSGGNLPLILQERFGWSVDDPVLTLAFGGSPITINVLQLLKIVFGGVVLLAGIGVAIQSRRNDPRILVALTAVWILMPSVLCQMGSRHYTWGVAVSCVLVGALPELTLWHVVITCIAAAATGGQLLAFDSDRSPQLLDLCGRFQPDDGWIILVFGGTLLILALIPARRPSYEELTWPCA